MTPSTDVVLLERVDTRILVATLNRPKAANAVNLDLACALENLADTLESETDIDAVVLTGAGKQFCSGGDVSVFASLLSPQSDPSALAALLDDLSRRVHGALLRIVEAGPLIVGAINGAATGAGLGLVCACDLAYAAPNASLRPGFSTLGLSPDTGTTYFIPRVLGPRAGLEFMLKGDPMSAERAMELGVYQELIGAEPADFLGEVLDRTRKLIGSGPACVRATRSLLQRSPGGTLAEQLKLEQGSLVRLAGEPQVRQRMTKLLSR